MITLARARALALVVVILGPGAAPRPAAQNPPPSSLAGAAALFEKFAAAEMALDGMTGLSIAVLKDKAVWARGFGFADMENRVPAAPESAYRLASITKTITALAVLELVEAGKIDLDAEVQIYVPHFPRKKWPVTIRQLLGHLGGLSHYRNDTLEGHIKVPKNTREALAVFQDFDLVAEPGTRYNYSTYGYNLLGAVLEAAAGESYGAYVGSHIFAPLGMAASRLDNPDDIIPNRVRGYRLVDDALKNSEYVDISSRFAGGGVRSTVLDLLALAAGLMDGKLIGADTRRLMFTSMVQRDGRLTEYGMGWNVKPANGHFQASHTGAQPETRAMLIVFPLENFAVAAASNFEEANLAPYVKRLAELVLDEDLDSAAYCSDRGRRLIYSACEAAFSYGLSRFARDGRIPIRDDRDLAEAAAYFNACVDERALRENFGAGKRKVLMGIHPAANEAFTKVGAAMASRLKDALGPDGLRAYMKKGTIPFFEDYLRLIQSRPDLAKGLVFREDFVRLMSPWGRDWAKSALPGVRGLALTPAADFEMIGRDLRAAFAGASIYPDFSEDFSAAAAHFLEKGDRAKSARILNLSREFYPASPAPYAALAFASIWDGNTDAARDFFRKAGFLDPLADALSTDRFAAGMSRLREKKKLTNAIALGLLALELRPKNARLHLETGNMYALAGQREKAAEYYKKALAIDPALEAARLNLEKIEKSGK